MQGIVREPLDLLVAALRELEEDAVISYQRMTEIVGQDVHSRHPLWRKAREITKKCGSVFVPIPGVGFRKESNANKASTLLNRRRRRAYRQFGKALEEGGTVDSGRLDQGQRAAYFGGMTVLRSLRRATHGNSFNAQVRKSRPVLSNTLPPEVKVRV